MRWVAIALAALGPGLASAQDIVPGLRDIGGPRALAMGDAYRASSSGNEPLFLNPAGLSVYNRYQLDVYGLYEPQYGHREYQASIVDNATSAGSDLPLAYGVGYTNFASGMGDSRFWGNIVHVGVSYAVYPPFLYVGATGKYLNLHGATHANSITMDGGAILQMGQQFALGVVMYNIIDVKSPQAPRMLAFAINYGGGGPVHLEADWRLDFASVPGQVKFTISTGTEYLIYNMVWIRAGYIHDEVATVHNAATGTDDPSDWATTGFAVQISQMFSIDVAYRNEIGGIAAKEAQVGVKVMF